MRGAVLALATTVAACGRAGFDPSTVDAPPPADAAPDAVIITGPCTGTELYDDGFDDGMPPPVFEITAAADLTVVEANSRLEIHYATAVAANHYGGYRTTMFYPAEGICAQVEIDELPVRQQGAYFKMFGATKTIEFFVTAGSVMSYRTQLNDVVDFSDDVEFNPTTMRFWRFRVAGGVTHWDTSADGVTFIERTSRPEFFAGVNGRLEVGAGEDQAVTNGTTIAYAGARAFGP